MKIEKAKNLILKQKNYFFEFNKIERTKDTTELK
jgi:hypothetical protein